VQQDEQSHVRAMTAATGGRHIPPSQLSDAMVEQIAARFRLLGEPLRLKLLAALEGGERNVGDLVALTAAGQANVSKHLAALAQAGLVRRRKVGTSTYYAIADETAFTLCDVVCAGLQEQVAAQVQALGMDAGGRRQSVSGGPSAVRGHATDD
jgi:DNA-binding transcriptional ArsR family regulator